MDFFLTHWAELLLALMVFAKVVVNLTPSINDDRVFAYVDFVAQRDYRKQQKTREVMAIF